VSEFEPEYGAYDGYADPGVDGGITPADLVAVEQSAAEYGAARVLAEMTQAQQQQQQFNIDQQAAKTLGEAEQALRAHDPGWDALRPYAASMVAAHPTLLAPEALFDPEIAAENLWNAAQAGVGVENNQRAQAKAADDERAFQRIKSEHRKTWTAHMADSGQTIHDLLADS
jgi:hypothetical protein